MNTRLAARLTGMFLAYLLAVAAWPAFAAEVIAEQIDLIRHGESEDNPDRGQPVVSLLGRIAPSPGKVLSGWNASSLTMRGVAQAVQAGEALKARDAQAVLPMSQALWVYSPQLRTQQTLAGVLTGAGLATPEMMQLAHPDTRVQERSAGRLTGLTWDQAAQVWDEMRKGRDAGVFKRADEAYPEGESLALVYQRAAAALDGYVTQSRRIIVVSHELTIKAMIAHLLRHRIDDTAFAVSVENGKPFTLRRVGGEWVLDRSAAPANP